MLGTIVAAGSYLIGAAFFAGVVSGLSGGAGIFEKICLVYIVALWPASLCFAAALWVASKIVTATFRLGQSVGEALGDWLE